MPPTIAHAALGPRRQFLGRRLARFGLVGFAAVFGALVLRVALGAGLGSLPSAVDLGGQLFASLALLSTWAVVRDRDLSVRVLSIVDVAAMNGVAIGFATMASNLPVTAHPTLVLLLALTFTFSVRATYVPSSVRQTVLVHGSAVIWLLLSAAHDASRQADSDPSAVDASLRGQLITATIWWLFNSGAAVAATSVIYGLRNEVREAMQLGQYTLEGKLGEGGMGAVFRARHALLRRPTAVKLLPPRRSDEQTVVRFEREVQRTAQISHPNVVTVFDYGRTHDGIFYYAMEHLDGLDLEELVGRFGPLPPARAIHVLRQICEGLAAAHDVGLVHRDIKPANVFVLRGGRAADLVKIVDFGLVKEMDDAGAGPPDGGARIVGTPACLAPEAIESPEKVDERSDLYAVGAVGYFLLAGHHVFVAKSIVEVLSMHLHDPPPRLPGELPEGLEEIVMKCLAKSPEDRPKSAAALHDLLASIDDVRPWSIGDAQRWWADVPGAAPPSDASAMTTPAMSVDLAARDVPASLDPD